jgi:CRISPR type IV-associated protein Csf1
MRINSQYRELITKHISQFFPPTEGNKSGTCIVCGTTTDKGNKIDFSANFTAWSLLQHGDCICEYCYTLCRTQDYRRKSWVANKEDIKFLQRSEILQTILNPPNPPFAIYITKTGKKQGFLHLINKPAFGKDRFFIAFDDKLIFIERKLLKELTAIAKKARELKFTKTELLTEPSPHRWENRLLCEQILKYNKNPMWEVVVFAVE